MWVIAKGTGKYFNLYDKVWCDEPTVFGTLKEAKGMLQKWFLSPKADHLRHSNGVINSLGFCILPNSEFGAYMILGTNPTAFRTVTCRGVVDGYFGNDAPKLYTSLSEAKESLSVLAIRDGATSPRCDGRIVLAGGLQWSILPYHDDMALSFKPMRELLERG